MDVRSKLGLEWCRPNLEKFSGTDQSLGSLDWGVLFSAIGLGL